MSLIIIFNVSLLLDNSVSSSAADTHYHSTVIKPTEEASNQSDALAGSVPTSSHGVLQYTIVTNWKIKEIIHQWPLALNAVALFACFLILYNIVLILLKPQSVWTESNWNFSSTTHFYVLDGFLFLVSVKWAMKWLLKWVK